MTNAARGSSVEIDGRTYTVRAWKDEDGFDRVGFSVDPPISDQHDVVLYEYIGRMVPVEDIERKWAA